MSSKVETLTIKPYIMITYCLTAFPLTPNTWLWMTLNPDFVLNCVLRQHVWSYEAWLSKHYTCKECCWRTSTEKNTCGVARFPCGSTAFLWIFVLIWRHLAFKLLPSRNVQMMISLERVVWLTSCLIITTTTTTTPITTPTTTRPLLLFLPLNAQYCTKTRDGEQPSQERGRACGRPSTTWTHQMCGVPRHGCKCNSDWGPAASGGPTVLANDRNGGRLRRNASRHDDDDTQVLRVKHRRLSKS